MKILEVCPYSTSGCGVWTRAIEESVRLANRGHDVRIFSSNFVKGKEGTAKADEVIRGLRIKRFPAKKLGGESFMQWDYEKEALAFNPEVIIVHNYRHLHTTKALKIAKKLKEKGKKCRVYLVTHAPFVEGNITRRWFETILVKLYDLIIGRFTLNKFDKIFPISKWEIPYLLNLGVRKEKIVYIPNGIPEEFFKQKMGKEKDFVLFLGRIAPKKTIETLIESTGILKRANKKISVQIVGPTEKEYFEFLKSEVKKNNVEKEIKFLEPIYDLKEKIKKLDSAGLYVLPSRVEGMPQALIEAMARGKVVIGSDSIAIRDLIKNGENGFLFEFRNPKDLAKKIERVFNEDTKNLKENAKKSVEIFNWNKVIDKIEMEIK